MASIARILLTGLAAVLLAAGPLHAGNNDPAPKLNRISIHRTMSKASDYVDKYAEAAMEQMRRYGIPASVTLAQGILESASGQSELSRKGNNHFGIKATKTWLDGGGRYLVYTDDKPNEKFCQYASVADSYEHHSLFLRGNKRYSNLFELSPDDYVGWTRGLQEDGYASSKQYASSLQSLIKQHGLDRYDRQVMQEKGWQSTLAPTTSTTDLAAHSKAPLTWPHTPRLFWASSLRQRHRPLRRNPRSSRSPRRRRNQRTRTTSTPLPESRIRGRTSSGCSERPGTTLPPIPSSSWPARSSPP